MIRVAVVYATVGRPDLLRRTVAHLAGQVRGADIVLVSTVSAADVAGIDALPEPPEVVLGTKGLCAQRNAALAHLDGRADLIVFFDDDFLPAADFLAEAAALFEARPALAGATGRVIADGIKTSGIRFEDALDALARDVPPAAPSLAILDGGLYGCNMVIRASMAQGMRFDEALPLYGWLEDLDFTYRLRRRGELASWSKLRGVHLGTKAGRNSGIRFGYSQIANPVHMLRKRSAPRRHVTWLMVRNVASNLVRSLRPEPYVDRAGRLRGNLLALRDLLAARIDPRRILELE